MPDINLLEYLAFLEENKQVRCTQNEMQLVTGTSTNKILFK